MPPDELAARLALYLVADPEATRRDLVADTIAALDGGVTAVQLRAKQLHDRELWELATRLRQDCQGRSVLFIVNDRLDLALAVGADGVHLGLHDLPLAAARRIAGPRVLIGASPQTIADAVEAREQGADYVGAGPVFVTGSKADAGEPIGLDGLHDRALAAAVPTVGIGGITAENAAAVIAAGAVGVSVISAILGADDPAAAAAVLASAVAI
ncbi:MAG: thiamine phosphate synthase, partial [Chloroflexota bacterium]|nr:thiamine phosphate synthase [Chloroflexota bacterium]